MILLFLDGGVSHLASLPGPSDPAGRSLPTSPPPSRPATPGDKQGHRGPEKPGPTARSSSTYERLPHLAPSSPEGGGCPGEERRPEAPPPAQPTLVTIHTSLKPVLTQSENQKPGMRCKEQRMLRSEQNPTLHSK